MTANDRTIVQDICKKTLENRINLEEFYSSWPRNAPENDFFDQIYEDLEYAITHTPGYFLKRGVDRKAWENSFEYLIIYLDYSLLLIDKNDEDLLHLRHKILELVDVSVRIIDKAISDINERNHANCG